MAPLSLILLVQKTPGPYTLKITVPQEGKSTYAVRKGRATEGMLGKAAASENGVEYPPTHQFPHSMTDIWCAYFVPGAEEITLSKKTHCLGSQRA